MATTKYSRQREAIKEYLSHSKEHPTADTIYMDIRETYPNISLGTVYRNLNLLVDKGEVMKIIGMDGSDRYDGNTQHHYHFLCNKCQRVLDIDMDSIDRINDIANKNFPGKVEGHVTYFYGKCNECE
ncbi:MAG: transcriptional repressor [Anaerolineaceae bacterium]|nr:MAG: transcriptional repressor [Anaerolineaceae bacterium]